MPHDATATIITNAAYMPHGNGSTVAVPMVSSPAYVAHAETHFGDSECEDDDSDMEL